MTANQRPLPKRDARGYVWAAVSVAAATGIARLASGWLPVESLLLFFLVPVLLIAARFGTGPSLLASALSFLGYNYFLTEPYYSLIIADRGVTLTLFLFLVVAVLMGNMAARLRARVEAEKAASTERARLAAEMEQARLVAEKERLRSALLSSVSHDLRTPLVSIIGAATSLLETPDAINAESRQQLLETIRDEGERLNRYVQNLLDMTRISHGALAINTEWIEPRELVGGAVRQLRRELRGHTIRVNVPPDLPAVQGDPLLLEQVLVNLLDNAGRYTPPGTEIEVSGALTDGGVRLAVTDQGPGIPDAERERVFDMFFRSSDGDSHSAGTGLGLAICKGILAAHGGSIRALPSPSGAGARLELDLPSSSPRPSEMPPDPPDPRLSKDVS